MAKGYWIIHVSVTNPEPYQEYIRRDTPIIEGLGGRFIVRGGTSEMKEGELLQRHVIVEFDSYPQALAAWDDPAYQEVAEIRRANAESDVVIIEGT